MQYARLRLPRVKQPSYINYQSSSVEAADMAQTARQMHLGVYVMGTGHHVAGWRLPEAQAGAENFPLIMQIAQTAERGKFDLFFLADALTRGRPCIHRSWSASSR